MFLRGEVENRGEGNSRTDEKYHQSSWKEERDRFFLRAQGDHEGWQEFCYVKV